MSIDRSNFKVKESTDGANEITKVETIFAYQVDRLSVADLNRRVIVTRDLRMRLLL